MEKLIKATEFDDERVEEKKMISATPYSEDWLIETLRENDDTFAVVSEGTHVVKITARNISDGKGYVSEVSRVTIHFEDGRTPYEVILKVPSNATMTDMYEGDGFNREFVAAMHNSECDFYELCAPQLSASAPIPKVFKTVPWIVGQPVGCILMESIDHAESVCPFTTLNEQQVRSVIVEMAKFHATFVLSDDSGWKNRFPNAVFNSDTVINQMVPFLEALADEQPHIYGEMVSMVLPYLNSKKFRDYITCDAIKDYGIPSTLMHGDLWTNNILFELDAEGAISSRIRAIFDFQVVCEGSGLFDIARLLTLSTDGDIRRRIEVPMLNFYFEEFGRRLREGGVEVLFDSESLHRVYRAHFVYQAITLLHIPEFLKGNIAKCETLREQRVFEAQLQKLRLRAVQAMEDARIAWDELPLEKLI